MATQDVRHWDACHAAIFLEMVAEGRSASWVNEVLGSHGFGPFDLDETRKWLADTGGKCRCDDCWQSGHVAEVCPPQLSLFG